MNADKKPPSAHMSDGGFYICMDFCGPRELGAKVNAPSQRPGALKGTEGLTAG